MVSWLPAGADPAGSGAGSGAGGVWPGREADGRPALRVYNPATQGLLDRLREAAEALAEALGAGDVDAGDALGVAGQVYAIEQQVRGVHYAAVGMADQGGLWGIAGYTSTNAWLRHTHLVGGRGANRVSRTARWLGHQSQVAGALGAGEIGEAHVQVMRAESTSSPARAAAFGEVVGEFVQVARHADAEYLARVMRSWGDVVDEQASGEAARRSHDKRGVFLSPVGDGWDLRGWLSAADGAELAGLLNAQVNTTRRENPDISMSAAQRRADALLELARAAAAGGFSPAARDRAKVLVLVPMHRLAGDSHTGTNGSSGGSGASGGTRYHLGGANAGGSADPGGWPPEHGRGRPPEPGELPDPDGGWTQETRGGEPPDVVAAQWRTGNGPGRGHLGMDDARRLSCDGAIQRVVLSPESVVLDVGRAQRLVTPAIRTALEVRDGGCVIPGCDRPSGWCEAHHIVHWSAGGNTSLQNLVLACSRHHHEIHHGTWRIGIDETGQVRVAQTTRQLAPLRR